MNRVLRFRLMPDGRPTFRLAAVAAGLLLAIFVLQGLYAGSLKSPTFDETGDIAAGLSYIQHLDVRANLQHPPLMKHLAGVALWLAGMRLGDTAATSQMLTGRGGERTAGSEFLARTGVERALAIARLPFLLCTALLGLLLFLWARELAGPLAAAAALLLYTLDPNVMAHGYLAIMDMGLAAFAMLFLFALWKYIQAPDTRRLIWCGAAMGLMLAAKFSSVFLLPVAAVLLWIALPRGAAIRAFLLCCGIATLVVQALYLSPGGLFLYATGLGRINADHSPDYLVFLGGHLEHSFASYFPVAWLLKEPLATLLFGIVGLLALRDPRFSRNARLFLLLPPAAILAGHMLFADDLGVRYILPALPFAHLIGGIGAAWLLSRRRGLPVAALLALWLIAGTIAVYPDQLSYFNEAACLPGHLDRIGAAGGTACGPLWLDDSNVDWGQGLPQLRAWLDGHAHGRSVRLAYFGSYPPQQYLPSAKFIGIDDLMHDPAPGLYAVSAHLVARVPAMSEAAGKSGGQWLQHVPPVAIVGHAIYVYEISGPVR